MQIKCSACGQDKDCFEFHRATKSRTGFQHKCKVCDKLRSADWYEKNRSLVINRTTNYSKQNPHIRRAASNRYRQKNPEKVKEIGRAQRHSKPDIFKERDAKFARKYPQKIAAKTARRRAQKLLATPAWSDPKAVELFYTCAAAMTLYTGQSHHVDHIVPLKSKIVCGLHCPANFQILLGAVNSSKGNRYWPDMPDFLEGNDMAKRTPVPFNTPPGRFIGGSLYQGSTKDDKGNLKVYKTGANAGQPRTDYSVGIAIPKTKAHWAEEPGWGQVIWAEGHAAWPAGQAQHPSFAWKLVDGDSNIPNKKMKKPCDQEGYPGHWVLWFGGTTPPKLAVAIGTQPEWNDQPGFCMPGDIIEVKGSVVGNESNETAGVYINYDAVCMRAYHQSGRIVGQGIDLATAGFGSAPLPSGASTMPVGNALAAPPAPGATPSTPAAPPAPAAPAHAPSAPVAAPLAPVTPNPAILGAPAPVVVPPAPVPSPVVQPPPAPASPRLMKNGGVYDDWVKAGWTDASLREAGHID